MWGKYRKINILILQRLNSWEQYMLCRAYKGRKGETWTQSLQTVWYAFDLLTERLAVFSHACVWYVIWPSNGWEPNKSWIVIFLQACRYLCSLSLHIKTFCLLFFLFSAHKRKFCRQRNTFCLWPLHALLLAACICGNTKYNTSVKLFFMTLQRLSAICLHFLHKALISNSMLLLFSF